ncbi:uncharacterized protein LOC143139573 [Alosa pseudoharengus]|uniref:uncharacterized protein LOC143139573 n=1 Tax=Alosa pseudoharengus TaxID=34774 RepID=UPI003F8B97D3
MENGNRKPPGADTTKVKCYKVAVVSLGLLCVLLLIVNIRMVTKHITETDQLQRHMDPLHSNFTKERDLFQERNTNLTKERDQLQLTNSNLTKERDLFQERNTNLTKERNQLEVTEREVRQENQQLRAGTIEVKCYKVSVVSLGLLCVLLLAIIIWMVTKHTAETDQLQRNMDLLHSNLIKERDLFEERNTNLTKERDQLQLTNSNLTKERDLFQEKNTNLTKERNQLEITKGQVSQENHQLRDINRNLTAEKNDLMDKNRKLIAEKEKLLNAIQIPQGWRRFW